MNVPASTRAARAADPDAPHDEEGPLLFKEELAPSEMVLGLAAGHIIAADTQGVALLYESHVALFRESGGELERVATVGENLYALGLAHVPRGPGRPDWLVVVTRDAQYHVLEGDTVLFKAYMPPPVSPARMRCGRNGLTASVLPLSADTRFFEADDDDEDDDDTGSRRDMSSVVLVGWCLWEASITVVALDIEDVGRSFAMSQKLAHTVSSLSLFLSDRRVGGALVLHPPNASWLVSITDRSVAGTWKLEGCNSLCAVVPVVSRAEPTGTDELSLVLVERSGRLTVALVHQNAKMSYELSGRVVLAMQPGGDRGVLVLTEELTGAGTPPPRHQPWTQPRDVFTISQTEVRSLQVAPHTHWGVYDAEHLIAFDASTARVLLLRTDWTRGAPVRVVEQRAFVLPPDERAARLCVPPGIVAAAPVGDGGSVFTSALLNDGASSVLSLLEQGCAWDVVYGGEQSPVLVPPQSATPMLFAVPSNAQDRTSAALLFAHPLTQQTQAMDISGDVFGEVTLPFLDHNAFTLALGCVADGVYVQVIANGIKLGSSDGVVTVWAPPIESRVHVASVFGVHVVVACGDTLFLLRVDVAARAVLDVGSRTISHQVSALTLAEHEGALLVALGTWVDNRVLVLGAEALDRVLFSAQLGNHLPRTVLLAQLGPTQPLSLFAGSADGLVIHMFAYGDALVQRTEFRVGDTAVQLLRLGTRVLATSTRNAVLHVVADDGAAPAWHSVTCARMSDTVAFQCCAAVHTPALPDCVAWLDMHGRMGFGGLAEGGAVGVRARHFALDGEATHVVVHVPTNTAYVCVARPSSASGGTGTGTSTGEAANVLLAMDVGTMTPRWARALPGNAAGMDLVRYANGDVALGVACNHTVRVSDLRQAAQSTVQLFALDALDVQPALEPVFSLEQDVFSTALCAIGGGRLVLATSHHLQVISGHMLASQVLLPTALPIVEMCTSDGTWLAVGEVFGRVHVYRIAGDNAVLVASTDPSRHPLHTCVSMCFVGGPAVHESDVSLLVASHQGHVACMRIQREDGDGGSGGAVLAPTTHANMRALCNVLLPTQLSVQPVRESAAESGRSGADEPWDVLGICADGKVVRFSHAYHPDVFELLLKVQGILLDGGEEQQDDNELLTHRSLSDSHRLLRYVVPDRCADVDTLSAALERAELYRLLRRTEPVSVGDLVDRMDPLKYHDMWLLHDMLVPDE